MQAGAGTPASAGIEIGNSRIKIVALTPEGPRAQAFPVALRGGPPRPADIAAALADAIAAFERDTDIAVRAIPSVVATSHQFAYPTFRDALRHTAEMVREHLPEALLASATGLHRPAEAAALADTPGGPISFAAARMPGIRALAERFGPLDLAVDCGSTSTEIVPLNADAGANEARLSDGRLVWIGLLETPLDYVAREAAGYTVVPRVARMAAVTGLLRLAGPSLGPVAADSAALSRELAQGVGLDPEILGTDEIARIAHDVRDQAIAGIAASISRVARRDSARQAAGLRAGIMGIGKAALATPALALCGIATIVDLERAAGVPANFGVAAGLALRAVDVKV